MIFLKIIHEFKPNVSLSNLGNVLHKILGQIEPGNAFLGYLEVQI